MTTYVQSYFVCFFFQRYPHRSPDVRFRWVGSSSHGRREGSHTRKGMEVHQQSGDAEPGDDELGEPQPGGAGGGRPSSQGRPLRRQHPQPAVDLEREGRLPQGLEQPGVLQRPLVPGNRQAHRPRQGTAGQGLHNITRGLLGISGPSRCLLVANPEVRHAT